MIDFPPPKAFGLPEKFANWRLHQVAAINAITNDLSHRFISIIAPTGSGKSLTYVAAAILSGARTLFLTSSKGLQSQLLRDFGALGMVDIRGRGNYRCVYDNAWCDSGPCIAGIKCGSQGHCPYFRALLRAAEAPLVVSNYAFWMASNEYSGGPLGRFDMIVCDEGHGLPDVVSVHLTVNLSKSDLQLNHIPLDLTIVGRWNVGHWRDWARACVVGIKKTAESMAARIRDGGSDRGVLRGYRSVKALERDLEKIANMGDDWVVDVNPRGVTFAPVWPKPFIEGVMWRGTKKVILTSATLCAKTLDMVGCTGEGAVSYEYPHTFPVANRRLVHIKTAQMNHRNEKLPEVMQAWLGRIDQIIGGRQDRKGIVHTVSYGRRDMVLAASRFRGSFVTHNQRDTEKQVGVFKGSLPPAVLVSPSMATGWDFPGEEARYQIIGKLAFPDTRDRITKARCEGDDAYGPYVAMQQLIQAVGRGTRTPDDWCETFIIDDNITWFFQRYAKTLAPKWFREAVGLGCEVVPVARKVG